MEPAAKWPLVYITINTNCTTISSFFVFRFLPALLSSIYPKWTGNTQANGFMRYRLKPARRLEPIENYFTFSQAGWGSITKVIHIFISFSYRTFPFFMGIQSMSKKWIVQSDIPLIISSFNFSKSLPPKLKMILQFFQTFLDILN